MAGSLRIVPFEDAQQSAVIELVLSIQQGEFDVPVTADEQPDLRVRSFFRERGGEFWTAVDDGAVVGTVGLVPFEEGRYALRKMFVAAPYRGRPSGTAAKLLGVCLDWARGRGARQILLGTFDKLTAAQRFYAKAGFVPIAAEDLPPGFPRMAVDNRFFSLSL